jgi:hypothetical protein
MSDIVGPGVLSGSKTRKWVPAELCDQGGLSMRQTLALLFLIGIAGIITGCDKDHIVRPNLQVTYTILWSRQQSPISIADTFVVEEHDTLLIEPGVVVQFEHRIPLIVKGTLLSFGAPSDSVVLTSLDWEWGGIHFLNSKSTSRVVYTTVTHCYDQALLIEDSSPYICKCRLEDSFTAAETGGQMVFCKGMSYPLIVNCHLSGFSNFEACGVYCQRPANPRLFHNNIIGYRAASDICVSGGGFLEGNYLAVYVRHGDEDVLVPDLSLGYPVDQTGDGVCSTNSTDSLGLFLGVDGVTVPRSSPNR